MRLQPVPAHGRPGRIAVEPDAAAHHRITRTRVGNGSGRVGRVQHGGVDAAVVELRDRCVEGGQLAQGEGAILLALAVGHGEMGPQALEAQQGIGLDQVDELSHGARLRPDAVHPGVDLEMDRRAPAQCPRPLGEPLDALAAIERRHESVRQRGDHRIGPTFAEQQDRSRHIALAQFDPFVDERDRESRRAAREARLWRRLVRHARRRWP